ncbi:MAG TPA: hypothetical protein VLF19_03465 [Methylomirabilota bacterium]|nr:hypothetical protein [Methylomirabilota bacterium]
MIGSFVIGAIAGGVAVWYYGPRIKDYVDETSRTVRSRTADTLQSAAETLQSAKQAVEPGSGSGAHGAGDPGVMGSHERRIG